MPIMIGRRIGRFFGDSSLLQTLTHSVEIDNEEKSRRQLFTIFLVLLVFPMILYGISQITMGHPEYGVIDIVLGLIMILFLFLLRIVKKAVFMYRFIALSALGMLTFWLVTGAVNGYASIWLLVFPPFIFFLLGRREGILWTLVISIVALSAFINPGRWISVFVYPSQYVIRLMTAFFLVVLFVYYYETLKEVFKSALKIDRESILNEKNLLAKAKEETEIANLLLQKEMEERRLVQEQIKQNRDTLEETVTKRTEEINRKNRALLSALETLEKTNIDLQNSKNSLSASEYRYRLLADNVIDMIWSTNLALQFTYISPSVKNIFGYTVEEAMALPFDKWSTVESNEKALNLISESVKKIYGYTAEEAKSRPFEEWSSPESNKSALNILYEKVLSLDPPDMSLVLEIDQIKKDGTVFPVEIKVSFLVDEKGALIGTVGITRDITERIREQKEKETIQEQLAQAQKMEAIGTLVGGLAHDFNNILGGIIGSFELIRLTTDNDDLSAYRKELKDYITMGMESANRSSSLIKQLLTLSKNQKLSLVPVDINQSLKHILVICKNSLPKSVILDFHITEESLFVLADEVQIEQVLLNLCINASHAMTLMRSDPAAEGGVLTVEAYRTMPDNTVLKTAFNKQGDGEWICVKISDTGVGIEPAIRHRLYEPFFTTKKPDHGTGLGLPMSYSIVSQHNGFIHVESEYGKGTSFIIFLPSHAPVIEPQSVGKPADAFIKGSGTVLIIDDEKLITNVVHGILKGCGYTVLIENSADRGIEVYRHTYDHISAVILDLSMPDKSGIEVYKALKNINPSVKAILSSGMVDDEIKHKAAKLGISHFLNKPFTGQELTTELDRLLHSST